MLETLKKAYTASSKEVTVDTIMGDLMTSMDQLKELAATKNGECNDIDNDIARLEKKRSFANMERTRALKVSGNIQNILN